MMSQTKIDLGEYIGSLKFVKQIINPRQWILVLGGNLI
jgi:hypothetical protein